MATSLSSSPFAADSIAAAAYLVEHKVSAADGSRRRQRAGASYRRLAVVGVHTTPVIRAGDHRSSKGMLLLGAAVDRWCLSRAGANCTGKPAQGECRRWVVAVSIAVAVAVSRRRLVVVGLRFSGWGQLRR